MDNKYWKEAFRYQILRNFKKPSNKFILFDLDNIKGFILEPFFNSDTFTIYNALISRKSEILSKELLEEHSQDYFDAFLYLASDNENLKKDYLLLEHLSIEKKSPLFPNNFFYIYKNQERIIGIIYLKHIRNDIDKKDIWSLKDFLKSEISIGVPIFDILLNYLTEVWTNGVFMPNSSLNANNIFISKTMFGNFNPFLVNFLPFKTPDTTNLVKNNLINSLFNFKKLYEDCKHKELGMDEKINELIKNIH